MAKKVGGGGAIMQPYDTKDGEYGFNEEGPVERNSNFTPKNGSFATKKTNLNHKDGKSKSIAFDNQKIQQVLISNRVDYYKYLTQDRLKNCIE